MNKLFYGDNLDVMRRAMLLEAKEAGQFKPEYHTAFDRLQIVTIQQILDGERMNLPLIEEVSKKVKRNISDGSDAQGKLSPEF